MSLCKNGLHPWTKGHCVECKRANKRRHADTDLVRARNAARMREKRQADRAGVSLAEFRAGLVPTPQDGLEDLYGPVPNQVPDEEWYDEVVVLRAVNQRVIGRYPTRPEIKAITARTSHLSLDEVARVTGAKLRTVQEWRERHGVTA